MDQPMDHVAVVPHSSHADDHATLTSAQFVSANRKRNPLHIHCVLKVHVHVLNSRRKKGKSPTLRVEVITRLHV
jgi:hypothetical protein